MIPRQFGPKNRHPVLAGDGAEPILAFQPLAADFLEAGRNHQHVPRAQLGRLQQHTLHKRGGNDGHDQIRRIR